MFFAPFVLSALKQGKEIYLLCLSKGIEPGLTRSEELVAAANVKRQRSFYFSVHSSLLLFLSFRSCSRNDSPRFRKKPKRDKTIFNELRKLFFVALIFFENSVFLSFFFFFNPFGTDSWCS